VPERADLAASVMIDGMTNTPYERMEVERPAQVRSQTGWAIWPRYCGVLGRAAAAALARVVLRQR
jgi:hypothetical protein